MKILPGNFNGDDIINIVLEQPDVAVYVTKKFWNEIISDPPDQQEISRLANIFRAGDYEIKPLMQALLTPKFFRKARQHGTIIKSPVDLLTGTMRLLQVPMGKGHGLVLASRHLGQDLMDPPNVKGWDGGNHWITSDTLLARRQILNRFLRGKEMESRRKNKEVRMSPSNTMTRNYMEKFGRGLSGDQITRVLLALPPVETVDPRKDRRGLISDLLLDPVYQLK